MSIQENRTEYERLIKDKNYEDVKFNDRTGALYAKHIDHNFDKTKSPFKGLTRGDYEKNTVNVLYNNGKKVILNSEREASGIETPDGTLDGKIFEIKGVEVKIDDAYIKRRISKASKQKVEVIVFYFHDSDMFDLESLQKGYKRYLGNSQKVSKVYYIVNNELNSI